MKDKTDIDSIHRSSRSGVFGLFPYPVHITEYPEELDEERAVVANLQYMPTDPYARALVARKHHVTKSTYVLDLPEFGKIRAFIVSALEHYRKNTLCVDNPLGITQSWITLLDPGTEIYSHTHPNSMVSGVFYFESTVEVPLAFIRSPERGLWTSGALLTTDSFNEFNCHWLKVPVEKPSLMLFSSTLEHMVAENMTNTPRYSLSFNTFPLNSFGDKPSMTEVDLSRLIRDEP